MAGVKAEITGEEGDRHLLVKKRVMECFSSVQQDGMCSTYVRVLKQLLVQSLAETRAAFGQAMLQFFQSPNRSPKLGKVYLLLKKFFEDCKQDVYTLNPDEESIHYTTVLKRHSTILAKDIVLLCCSVCVVPNYLVKLRASYILSTIFPFLPRNHLRDV